MALGIPVGYYVYKKTGAVICAVIMSIAGSEVGSWFMENVEESLENMLVSHKEKVKKRARMKKSESVDIRTDIS